MSTRGGYGFYRDSVDKITYNHFDSYPSYLGENFKKFIQNNSIEELNILFDSIVLLNEDDKVDEEIKTICIKNELYDDSVRSGIDYYSLLRNLQGNFEKLKDVPYMIDYKEFLGHSLFCEWAYVFNLDTNKLEVYKGSQKELNENRFKDFVSGNRYYNVKLIKEIPYEELESFDISSLE